jgi:L-seryl-tRNA(Ser) seleniumtransferase
MKKLPSKSIRSLGRRDIFRAGAAAAGTGLLSWFPASAAAAPPENPLPVAYTKFGGEPFINCTATVTINGGSRQLPEVIAAIEQASHFHVNLDQLMEAAGKHISELLKVEWGMVTSGAAAALSHATAGIVAGTDPELMQQLPNLAGMKDEVIIPRESRNQYDHAVRGVGLKTVEVDSIQEFREAINERTALAMILGNRFDDVRVSLKAVAPIAKQAGIPILVDAAADYLIVPNPYIAEGADLVAYSGGKILRGPQTAGLLVGREDLVRAAFANSAPHHAFGRPMKVSKEEIAGMVTAVEVWVHNRDLKAEYQEWESWYAYINKEITKVDGVTTEIRPPSRGGPFPTLWVDWDPNKIGMTAGELHDILLSSKPSIQTHASGDGHGFILRPVAMKPNEYKLVSEQLYSIFRKAPKGSSKPQSAAAVGTLSGRWDVDVRFARGQAKHRLFLEARGSELVGTHIGSRKQGELKGKIDGDKLTFSSVLHYEGSRLGYEFSGKVSGDRIEGKIDLGEYPNATFTAVRHGYGAPQPRDPSKSGAKV